MIIEPDHYSDKMQLRMGAIICITILGLCTIIGIFWGSEGMINIGLGLLFIIIAAIMILGGLVVKG